jgi:hypothetical protein
LHQVSWDDEESVHVSLVTFLSKMCKFHQIMCTCKTNKKKKQTSTYFTVIVYLPRLELPPLFFFTNPEVLSLLQPTESTSYLWFGIGL